MVVSGYTLQVVAALTGLDSHSGHTILELTILKGLAVKRVAM